MFLIPILHQTTTSSHPSFFGAWLFLIPILHQTTTLRRRIRRSFRCFSFQFYIKPQPMAALDCAENMLFLIPILHQTTTITNAAFEALEVVSHSNSTSNHNFYIGIGTHYRVVSHSNSTSNHNYFSLKTPGGVLFLIPILHQTTTALCKLGRRCQLFLIPILHQTTTANCLVAFSTALFLIPILHQTTT